MNQVYKGKLLRIIDADTIEAAIFLGFNISIKKKIRLIGVNAPEIRTKDLKTKEKGLAAKAFLESLLTSKDLIIKSKGFDKYGRCLAEVIVDEVNLGEKLISEGYAQRIKN
jgi:endonuclease YncB( thermonuclease family)